MILHRISFLLLSLIAASCAPQKLRIGYIGYYSKGYSHPLFALMASFAWNDGQLMPYQDATPTRPFDITMEISDGRDVLSDIVKMANSLTIPSNDNMQRSPGLVCCSTDVATQILSYTSKANDAMILSDASYLGELVQSNIYPYFYRHTPLSDACAGLKEVWEASGRSTRIKVIYESSSSAHIATTAKVNSCMSVYTEVVLVAMGSSGVVSGLLLNINKENPSRHFYVAASGGVFSALLSQAYTRDLLTNEYVWRFVSFGAQKLTWSATNKTRWLGALFEDVTASTNPRYTQLVNYTKTIPSSRLPRNAWCFTFGGCDLWVESCTTMSELQCNLARGSYNSCGVGMCLTLQRQCFSANDYTEWQTLLTSMGYTDPTWASATNPQTQTDKIRANCALSQVKDYIYPNTKWWTLPIAHNPGLLVYNTATTAYTWDETKFDSNGAAVFDAVMVYITGYNKYANDNREPDSLHAVDLYNYVDTLNTPLHGAFSEKITYDHTKRSLNETISQVLYNMRNGDIQTVSLLTGADAKYNPADLATIVYSTNTLVPPDPTLPTCQAGTIPAGFSCDACPAGKFNPTQGGKTCTNCAKGSYAPTTGSSHCVSCNVGYFASTEGNTECTKCPAGQYADGIASEACLQCGIGEYSDEGASSCMRCPIGTYQNARGMASCNQCPPTMTTRAAGAYSLADCVCPADMYWVNSKNACVVCKEGCTNPDGQPNEAPFTLANYFATKVEQTEFTTTFSELSVYRCRNNEACPGVRKSGVCGTKYTGVFCDKCVAGYYMYKDKCYECGDINVSAIIFYVLGVVVVFFLPILAYVKLNGPTRRKQAPLSLLVAVFGQLIVFLQAAALFEDFYSTVSSSGYDVSVARGPISIFSIALFNIDFLRVECMLQSISADLSTPFTLKYILRVILPLAIIVVLLIYYWLASVFPRFFGGVLRLFGHTQVMEGNDGNDGARASWEFPPVANSSCKDRMLVKAGHVMQIDRLFNTYGYLFSSFFISVARSSFDLFICTQHPNGKWSLVSDPSFFCFEGEWNNFVVIAILAGLIYCVGFIAAAFYIVLAAPKKFPIDKRFRIRFNFMVSYTRFRPNCWWYYLPSRIRGLLLVLAFVVASEASTQAFLLLIINTANLLMLCIAWPWPHLVLNILDVSLTLILMGMSFCVPAILYARNVSVANYFMNWQTGLIAWGGLMFVLVFVYTFYRWWRMNPARDAKKAIVTANVMREYVHAVACLDDQSAKRFIFNLNPVDHKNLIGALRLFSVEALNTTSGKRLCWIRANSAKGDVVSDAEWPSDGAKQDVDYALAKAFADFDENEVELSKSHFTDKNDANQQSTFDRAMSTALRSARLLSNDLEQGRSKASQKIDIEEKKEDKEAEDSSGEEERNGTSVRFRHEGQSETLSISPTNAERSNINISIVHHSEDDEKMASSIPKEETITDKVAEAEKVVEADKVVEPEEFKQEEVPEEGSKVDSLEDIENLVKGINIVSSEDETK